MTVPFLVVPARALLAAALVASLVAFGAACGGGSEEATGPASVDVPADAIALVAGKPVPKAAFDRLFGQAQQAYEAQGREFPVAGTPEYEELKQQAVEVLVQRVEFELEAELLGLEVTDEDVDARLTELKDQYFEGDDAKYEAELENLGLTDGDVRDDIRASLTAEALNEEITKDASVTDEGVRAYYDENIEEFTVPDTREVAHILVETEEKANELLAELENGAAFGELAKQHSTDAASAQSGGELTARMGELVPEFEEVAFVLETGAVSDPVESQYGWHLIKALGDVEPEVVTPFEDVEEAIREQLLQAERNTLMADWVAETAQKYASQIAYAAGFAPPPTIATPATTSTVP